MVIHPAWRFILALRSSGKDPLLEGLPLDGGCDTWNKTTKILCDVLCGSNLKRQLSSGEQREYEYTRTAYRFYKLQPQRYFVETYLMIGGSEEWLLSAIGIDVAVLEAYKKAFFDLSAFRNWIDKIEYINKITDDTDRKIKKQWNKGCEYIKWQMGFKVGVDAKSVMSSLLVDVYYKHKNAQDSKEAAKWCEVASKIGKDLVDDRDTEDLRGKLEQLLTLDTKEHTYKSLAELNDSGEGD